MQSSCFSVPHRPLLSPIGFNFRWRFECIPGYRMLFSGGEFNGSSLNFLFVLIV